MDNGLKVNRFALAFRGTEFPLRQSAHCVRVELLVWAVFVVVAWRDEHEEAIPAATVANIDRANRAAREARLPTLRPAS